MTCWHWKNWTHYNMISLFLMSTLHLIPKLSEIQGGKDPLEPWEDLEYLFSPGDTGGGGGMWRLHEGLPRCLDEGWRFGWCLMPSADKNLIHRWRESGRDSAWSALDSDNSL